VSQFLVVLVQHAGIIALATGAGGWCNQGRRNSGRAGGQ